MTENILKKIKQIGLIPVVVIEDAGKAIDVAEALLMGGLGIMEITMRTNKGLESIRRVKKAYPKMLVGAGTVLSIEKAEESVNAGAEFIVSPGFNDSLVEWCLKKKVAVTPGCVTPTEIGHALQYGLTVLKFFPANIYGGIHALKALWGPFNMVSFIPTGGINAANLADYADKPFVHAVGGGWLCEKEDINKNRYEKIIGNVQEAIGIMNGFELAHQGLSAENENEEESFNIVQQLEKALGFEFRSGTSSNPAGNSVDVTKSSGTEKRSHITVRTNNIERACFYLENRGFKVDQETTSKDISGHSATVCLWDQTGSLGVHLFQK